MSISEMLHPQNLEQCKEMLERYKHSKILAGGTDLVLDLRRGNVEANYLINLNNVAEMKSIEERESSISVGSMITFTELKENPLIKKHFNALICAANSMGSPQIRNIATIGGNVVNGASAADIVPCLMCLGGILNIESKNSKRNISCVEYFNNYLQEFIKDNEILTEIILPKANGLSGFYKLGKRNALAISRISASVNINIVESKIQVFKVALGAVGRYPFLVEGVEKIVLNKEINYILQEDVTNLISNVVSESIKLRKTMPFKKEAVKGVYKEAVLRALMCGGNLNE